MSQHSRLESETSGYSVEESIVEYGSDEWWLARARSAFRTSSDWFDSSVRRKIEDNLRIFNSQHPQGSKYHHAAYAKRSKLFRPKIRSATRKLEAAGSAAFFSTQDAVSCVAPNPGDDRQKLTATVQTELLNYRLDLDIPWYLTVIGALQDTFKQGAVISKQMWNYQEVEEISEESFIRDGIDLGTVRTVQKKVYKDHPDIILVPIENIRLSPAADWRDPINSSPYLIDREPFFVHEVLERAGTGAQRGHTAWRNVTLDQIRSSLKNDFDSIRQAREGIREDRFDDVRTDVQTYDVCWVHHNFMRVDGEDWYYDTLGEEFMLSVEPVPSKDIFPTLKRPYVFGYSTIETHKPYPAGVVELASPLSEESNDVTNLRLDAIRHVLSPRYFIRRGQSIDIQSLMKNVPGGVTTMDDPNTDVKVRTVADPTAGSYQEQDRLNLEIDDLIGNFSGSSVANNRNMNETVGGMNLLNEGADEITEMTLMIFINTWAENALQQVMEYEQAYESDELVLSVVGKRAGVHPRAAFEMLKEPTRVKVNVGSGATSPMKKLEKLDMAISSVGKYMPDVLQKIDKKELLSEIFGFLGYKSSERFFPSLFSEQKDPEVQQLEQQVQQLQQELAAGIPAIQGRTEVARIMAEGKIKIEQLRLNLSDKKVEIDLRLKHRLQQAKLQKTMLDYRIKQESNELNKRELEQQKLALEHQIMMDELHIEAEINTKSERRNVPVNVNEEQQEEQQENRDMKKDDGESEHAAPNLRGNDKAGVIARDDFGNIPQAVG